MRAQNYAEKYVAEIKKLEEQYNDLTENIDYMSFSKTEYKAFNKSANKAFRKAVRNVSLKYLKTVSNKYETTLRTVGDRSADFIRDLNEGKKWRYDDDPLGYELSMLHKDKPEWMYYDDPLWSELLMLQNLEAGLEWIIGKSKTGKKTEKEDLENLVHYVVDPLHHPLQ